MTDYFLTYGMKKVIHYTSFISVLTFYVSKRHFPNVIRCLSRWCKSDVTSEIETSDVMFNIACELSQPMGKTKFSSTAKNRTNSIS